MFLLSVIYSHAQYQIKLVSVYGSQNKDSSLLRFGEPINLRLSYHIDSPRTMNSFLAYVNSYHLVLNGIPYSEMKIQNMEVVSNSFKGTDGHILYKTVMPDAMVKENGKLVLSKSWLQHYQPLCNEIPILASIVSGKPEDQVVDANHSSSLQFYQPYRVYVFVVVFLLLLVATIWTAANNGFTLFRDDPSKDGCTDPLKTPFSLSRIQVFVWTFVIFGSLAYVWGVTDFLPEMTAAHLVLLGIAAGQRILSQMIDAAHPPKKNVTTTDTGTCTKGFFTDLISDKSGLSITRLQYLISTFVFLVVFITTAIEKLQLVNFSVEQLALMGTSAGLYLWNKKLDQQKNPPPSAV